jgi:hypothetical protein
MLAEMLNEVGTDNPQIMVALIGGGLLLLGAIIGAAANYLISSRTLSRSGARLLADLQLLEKARALSLDRKQLAGMKQLAGIEARVR